MLGAIAGDMIGSRFERVPAASRDFELFTEQSRFTDDTVLTCAVANAILTVRRSGLAVPDYRASLLEFGRRHPHRGYGGMFRQWLTAAGPAPYNSFGNGSAMRVSPVGIAFDEDKVVLDHARLSAIPTHDHPEGVKGAQAVALAIWLARAGQGKEVVRARIGRTFGYDMNRSVEGIRETYRFDVTCQGSVPEAIIAFLDATDFETAVRNAIWLGGDADTQACIAGAIAEAAWGVPVEIERAVRERLAEDLLCVLDEFKTTRWN